MDTELRTVGIGNGVSLVVEMAGEGEPLVLLPGFGCSTRSFHLLIPHLVDHQFMVIAPNPRGIGGSTGPLDDLTLHDLADDVAGLLLTLDLAPAHVVGWAYGNRIARCLATDVPDVVKTVILLAAGGQVPAEPEAQAALGRLSAAAYETEEDRLRDLALALLAPTSDPVLGKWIEIGLWPEATIAQGQANRETPVDDWWNGGTKPILVIQGLDDRVAPPANGHALAEAFEERVTVIDLPDAGHAMIVERPEAVAHAISVWVNGEENRSGG